MAVDLLPIDLADVNGKKLGNIFIGRPIDRHTQRVAIALFKSLLELWVRKPVMAKPIQIGELLIWQLIHLAVWARGEAQTNEVV